MVFWTPGPMLFLVPGNSGKPDNLFLLEARHFTARVSSKIGKGGDVGPAGWNQEAVGFCGAADERNALDRSPQFALGLLIPSSLLHALRAEHSVCLSQEVWAWRCAWVDLSSLWPCV